MDCYSQLPRHPSQPPGPRLCQANPRDEPYMGLCKPQTRELPHAKLGVRLHRKTRVRLPNTQPVALCVLPDDAEDAARGRHQGDSVGELKTVG